MHTTSKSLPRRSRVRRRFAALGVAVVAVAGLTLATATTAVAGKQPAGSVVTVGAEEFPPVLNMITPEGNGQWTGMIVGPALARGYKLLPDFSYEPWIFDKDCTVPTTSPFTVDCTLRPEAKWSDNVPITADDFKFTFDTIMNKKNNVVSRSGYDKISQFNVVSPTEFQMVFDEVFAPVPRSVGRHQHGRAAEARARGQELQQGVERLHLRPEDEEAHRQWADARPVVRPRPPGHAGPEPELLGDEGDRVQGRVRADHRQQQRDQRLPRR